MRRVEMKRYEERNVMRDEYDSREENRMHRMKNQRRKRELLQEQLVKMIWKRYCRIL